MYERIEKYTLELCRVLARIKGIGDQVSILLNRARTSSEEEKERIFYKCNALKKKSAALSTYASNVHQDHSRLIEQRDSILCTAEKLIRARKIPNHAVHELRELFPDRETFKKAFEMETRLLDAVVSTPQGSEPCSICLDSSGKYHPPCDCRSSMCLECIRQYAYACGVAHTLQSKEDLWAALLRCPTCRKTFTLQEIQSSEQTKRSSVFRKLFPKEGEAGEMEEKRRRVCVGDESATRSPVAADTKAASTPCASPRGGDPDK